MKLDDFEKLWKREIPSKSYDGTGVDFGRLNVINTMIPKLLNLARAAKNLSEIVTFSCNDWDYYGVEWEAFDKALNEVFGDET